MNLVWRPEARRSLLDITAYVADRNPSAAQRLRDAILRTADRLPDHPYLHRPGRVPGTREAVIHPNYILVYRVGERIEISPSSTPAANTPDAPPRNRCPTAPFPAYLLGPLANKRRTGMANARDTIALSRGIFIEPSGIDDPRAPVRDWMAHVDAGRIGAPSRTAPEIAARRARAEALLRPRRNGSVW